MNVRSRKLKAVFMASVVAVVVGCSGNGSGPFKDVQLTLSGESVLINFPVKGLHVDIGGRIPIKEIKNAFVDVIPDPDGTRFAFSIPVAGLSSDWTSNDPKKLPCGQALPLAAGAVELPSLAIDVDTKTNLTFYLGKEMFAFFIPFNNKFPLQLTYAIKIGNSKVAYVTAIPNLPNQDGCGGAFLNFPIPKSLQKI